MERHKRAIHMGENDIVVVSVFRMKGTCTSSINYASVLGVNSEWLVSFVRFLEISTQNRINTSSEPLPTGLCFCIIVSSTVCLAVLFQGHLLILANRPNNNSRLLRQ